MSPTDRRKKLRRRLVVLGAIPVVLLLLWVAIHRIPGFGPLLADTGRAILGNAAIAKVEDFAYAVEDRWNRLWRSDERPQAYWDVPSATSATPEPPAPADGLDGGAPAGPAFHPANVEPMYPKWAAPGDGTWVPIPDARRPSEPARMYKTLLHPDSQRAWSAVAIVAVDLGSVDIHLVAGRHEPKSEANAPPHPRTGLVPPEHHEPLLAAFNGGYKATHGGFGMRVDGITLIRPKPGACTVALFDDGHLEVRTWEIVSPNESSMRWWRQTPGCMVELGKLHGGLIDGNTYWGATLDRETVIRRSAIGISGDGKTLFVGIGDACEARAIARAMNHAGAQNVAQLDVNWSFPKFLTFAPREPGSAEMIAVPLVKGFEYDEDDYLRERSPRDFFYLTRKP